MKKNRTLTTMLLLIFVGSLTLNAQSEKFKALFLYNFIKNIEWPEDYKQGDLIIGVLGNSSIAQELETITSSQRAGNQSLKIKVFSNVEDMTNCHVIFVSPNKGSSIPQLISKINTYKTLVVSNSKGAIQLGSAINFFQDGDKLKFEICKQHIDQKGLKVSANLLNLGVQVN